MQLVIQWVRAGRPRSSITNEAIAAGVDFPVDLVEAALGSPELLVATEIHQYAEMVVLRRPGPDDYAAALVSLATLHRELLSHFLSSAIEPHPNPTVVGAVDLLASPLDELAPPSAGRSATGSAQRCKLLVMAALDGVDAEELAGQIAAWAK